jgi:hypothetical protein
VFQVCGEKQRFEKLMEHFRNEDNNIDFMVSSLGTPFNNENSSLGPLSSKTHATVKWTQ